MAGRRVAEKGFEDAGEDGRQDGSGAGRGVIGMTRRVYVDSAWNSKPHICYDPDEDRFFEVSDLGELAGRYDEVYVDGSLFPNMWPQLEKLISNGARVFHFTWPWRWKKLRERYADPLEKRFGKTDYGDAYVLSRIYDGMPRAFAEITPLDVEFKPLLMREKMLADELRRLRQRHLLGIDLEDEIKDREERLERVRGEIVEKACERIPRFTEVAEELGLKNNDVNALSALAGLLIHLKWPYKMSSFHGAKRFLGLYRPTRKEMRKFEERNGEKYMKRYSGCARRYLALLTTAILRKERNVFPPRAGDEKEVLRRLLGILKTYSEAAKRVEGQDKNPNEACGHNFSASIEGVVAYLVQAKGCPNAPSPSPHPLFSLSPKIL